MSRQGDLIMALISLKIDSQFKFQGNFGLINRTLDLSFLDMFPMWAIPTNDNILQIIFHPPGSKEYVLNYKIYLSIISGRIMAMN